MKRELFITFSTCLVALSGCSKDKNEYPQSAVAWEAPTAWASGPVPNPDITNGAPLNNAAGYPEQFLNTSPDIRTALAPAGSEWTAAGRFVAAPGRRVAGEIELQEVGTSVRAHLEVEGGIPGVRRIVYSDDTDCATFEDTTAAAPKVSRDGLGALTIAEDGRGEATINVPNANLRPDSDGSLMHGAVLLYASERLAGVSKRREVPIACAAIASS